MTLDEAIEQQITLGGKDPVDIARRVESLFGREWITEQAAMFADEFVVTRARTKLSVHRRSAEVALRPGDEMSQADMKIAKAWIPGDGWVKVADLTADHLDKRASWYETFADASLKRALWCRDVAGMIRDDGVRTLGKLKRPLPALPEDGDDGLILRAA